MPVSPAYTVTDVPVVVLPGAVAVDRPEVALFVKPLLGADEADGLRALMQLDADGNGALTTAEVAAAVARLDGTG